MFINVPKYIWLMLVCTGLYLTIEIPYSIHLVSVLGGNPTQGDIDTIEKVGRLLTGIAVALAYVGVFVYPKMHKNGYTFSSANKTALFRSVPIVLAVYGGLYMYGETRGLMASGEDRKNAYISTLAKRALVDQGSQGVIPHNSPAWLGLVSGFPIIYSSGTLVKITGMDLDQLAMQEAKRVIGTPQAQYEVFIPKLRNKTDGIYNDYIEASNRYFQARNEIDLEADQAWSKYFAKITEKFGSRMPKTGGWDHSWAIRELRNNGLPVSEKFQLNDKRTFMMLFKEPLLTSLASRYSQSMERYFKGSGLKPGVSKEIFLANASVQRVIRDSMSNVTLPNGIDVSSDMTFKTFSNHVYPSILSGTYEALLGNVRKDAGLFSRNSMDELSDASIKSTSLPATALLLSIAGALFHIYKFSGYMFAAFVGLVRVNPFFPSFMKHVFASVLLVFSVTSMHDGSVTSKLPVESDTGIYGKLMTEAVNLQPGMFSVGNILGENALWEVISTALPAARLSSSVGQSAFNSPIRGSSDSISGEKSAGLKLSLSNIPIPAPRT